MLFLFVCWLCKMSSFLHSTFSVILLYLRYHSTCAAKHFTRSSMRQDRGTLFFLQIKLAELYIILILSRTLLSVRFSSVSFNTITHTVNAVFLNLRFPLYNKQGISNTTECLKTVFSHVSTPFIFYIFIFIFI